ncbi:MAG TPA: lysine-2,3-aminomutase-like protein, partial [Xanthobacteraceae bacterium]
MSGVLRMKSHTLRTPAALIGAGLAPPERLAELERVAARYAVAITPALADLVDPRDPHDPVARQFVPDAAELEAAANERADPIGDEAHAPVEGIVHRYPDRVLLKLTDICAAYCRFCFRRERVGKGSGLLEPKALAAALGYIRAHPQIWEVVLSGGDPLVLSARRLAAVAAELRAIEHVKILRVHTRVPVAAPSRITPALLRALKASGKSVYVAVHVNHPRELGADARRACARLVDAGIPLLSQTVLLRGVNNDAQVLGRLMRALVECRIKPYYLHHGDLAPGTAHWRTGIERGQSLMRALRGRYSG